MKEYYNNFILTVIAATLIIIAIKLYEPRQNIPTLKDMYNIKFESNKDIAKQKAMEVRLNAPIVTVIGGNISID